MEKGENTHSTTIRFLGLLKQPENSPPDPNSDFLELDESDVVWSPSSSPVFSDSADKISKSPPSIPSSPTYLRRHLHRQKSGLSAALSETDQNNAVRRKTMIPVNVKRSSEGKFVVNQHSAPVNVPVWPNTKKVGARKLGFLDEVVDDYDDVEDDDEEEMVPPHVMVARSHVMAFSVFEGVGRTLKGRDLRRVRNAVFQKTGFID